jgi:hypothetical protein
MAINSFPINTRTVRLDQILAAEGYADAAEAARDSSFANAKGAATIADARALVADNETFIVYAAGSESFDAYRRLSSTTQEFLGSYPVKRIVDAARQDVSARFVGSSGDIPIITDEDLGVVLAVNRDTGNLKGAGLSEVFTVSAPLETASPLPATGASLMVQYYGQSNATGTDATPALTTTQPYDNRMFNGGAFPADGTAASSNPSDYASLTDLVEATREVGVATACNYACSYSARTYGDDLDATSYIGVSAGKGGSPINGLVKSHPYYTDVTLLQWQEAFDLDATVKGLAVVWVQGESDQTNATAKATYKAALEGLQADLEDDVQAITSQTEPLVFLTYQTNSLTKTRSNVPMAQLELAQESDRFFLVSPIYHLPFASGGLHISNVGQRWLGAYAGRAVAQLKAGKQPQWLNPRGAVLRGDTVTLHFDVPTLPLKFDVTNLAAATDYGFAVLDGASADTIESISIEGDRVVIVLDAAPSGVCTVRYGLDYTGTGLAIATQGGGSGNLRDSSPDVVKISGADYPLYNWCPHFELVAQEIDE